jgi:hypothetical protein
MLRHCSRCRVVLAVLALLPFVSWRPLLAQSVISAKSGVVHYIEGDVKLDGDSIHPKFAQFPDVKNGQVLAAAEGRAEVLLTPGVFLRLSEDSSFRMVSNALSDTRVAILSGSALIEVVDLLEGNAVSAQMRDTIVSLPKRGLYRIEADSGLLRVYVGEAHINPGAGELRVKKNREVDLDAEKLEARVFDPKETDPFYRWSSRRASYIAAANVTSAQTVARSDSYGSSFFGRSSGSWSWNPYFGMFTFLPGSGMYMSPFGSTFYSPGAVMSVFIPYARQASPMSAFTPLPHGGGGFGSPSAGPSSVQSGASLGSGGMLRSGGIPAHPVGGGLRGGR